MAGQGEYDHHSRHLQYKKKQNAETVLRESQLFGKLGFVSAILLTAVSVTAMSPALFAALVANVGFIGIQTYRGIKAKQTINNTTVRRKNTNELNMKNEKTITNYKNKSYDASNIKIDSPEL